MSDIAFDAITRRASLLGLSAAGLAGLAEPLSGAAKKKGKKKKKKFDINTFCKPQADQCETAIGATCGGNPECAAALVCCQDLATCDFNAFFACVQAVSG